MDDLIPYGLEYTLAQDRLAMVLMKAVETSQLYIVLT